jgi:hypothetical protein
MKSTTFALFLGVTYLSVGLLSLMPAVLTPPPADAPPLHLTMLQGYLLGLLQSAVHLAIGLWGLVVWRAMMSSKTYARALAILFGVLAVIGLIPGLNTLFGTLPLHGYDVWLHGATAVLAAYFGWRPEAERRHGSATSDRREETILVAEERRVGHSDRRLPNSGEVL